MTDVPAPELHERLAALSARLEARARELDARKDSRAVFTHAYALMTAQIATELPTDPSFDPGWTAGRSMFDKSSCVLSASRPGPLSVFLSIAPSD